MVDPYQPIKPRQKKTIPTALWLSAILLMSIWLGGYVIMVSKRLDSQWQHQLTVASQTATTTEQRYKYFTVPGTSKPVLALPPFQYKSVSGLWVLVNKTHPLPITYVPKQLVTVPIPKYQNDTAIKVRPELVEPLRKLYVAAEQDGIQFMVRSAYRSSADQQAVVSTITDSSLAALPGESEHQTGLAVDINDTPVDCSNSCALDYAGAAWLARHAADYGFVVRYQADKVSVTGYPAESWHLRYVGVPLALAMLRGNLALEQVYPLISTAKARS